MESASRSAITAVLDAAPWSAGGFYSKAANPDFSFGAMPKQEQARLLSDFLDGKSVGDKTELAHILAHNFLMKKPEWMVKMLSDFAGWSADDASKEAARYLNSAEGKTMAKLLRESGARF